VEDLDPTFGREMDRDPSKIRGKDERKGDFEKLPPESPRKTLGARTVDPFVFQVR
jgi:hypothetical protein